MLSVLLHIVLERLLHIMLLTLMLLLQRKSRRRHLPKPRRWSGMLFLGSRLRRDVSTVHHRRWSSLIRRVLLVHSLLNHIGRYTGRRHLAWDHSLHHARVCPLLLLLLWWLSLIWRPISKWLAVHRRVCYRCCRRPSGVNRGVCLGNCHRGILLVVRHDLLL